MGFSGLRVSHHMNNLVSVFRFCSWLGSNPMAGHVRDFPCQSEGSRQCCVRPYQLGHGVYHHQNLSRYDGESLLRKRERL